MALQPTPSKPRIWVAVSVYLLLAILKKQLRLTAELSRILQVASISVFEKMPILQAFQCINSQSPEPCPANQLNLFN